MAPEVLNVSLRVMKIARHVVDCIRPRDSGHDLNALEQTTANAMILMVMKRHWSGQIPLGT